MYFILPVLFILDAIYFRCFQKKAQISQSVLYVLHMTLTIVNYYSEFC